MNNEFDRIEFNEVSENSDSKSVTGTIELEGLFRMLVSLETEKL